MGCTVELWETILMNDISLQLDIGAPLPSPESLMHKIIIKNKKKHFHQKGKIYIFYLHSMVWVMIYSLSAMACSRSFSCCMTLLQWCKLSLILFFLESWMLHYKVRKYSELHCRWTLENTVIWSEVFSTWKTPPKHYVGSTC
jgi:hypothetical protein